MNVCTKFDGRESPKLVGVIPWEPRITPIVPVHLVDTEIFHCMNENFDLLVAV